MISRVIFAVLCVAWVGEAPVELDAALYNGLWRSPLAVFAPLFVPLPGIHLFALQLLLIGLVPLCATMPAGPRHRAREMDVAIFVSVACIAITFLWGWLRGGVAYYAYYQLWRFMTALLVAYMLMSAIRSPRELRMLAITIICAALVRGTLVAYYYWVHVYGKMARPPEYMTNHDDSLLFMTAIVIAGTWAIVTHRRAAWIGAIFVSLLLFNAMVLNNRRLAWLELVFAMVVIYFMIGASPLRRRINRWLIVAVPATVFYLIVGWGQEGALFAPIQALSSAGSDSDASSLARLEEMRNLIYTMSLTNPLFGTGWGLPYQKLTSIYANYSSQWILAYYTPHNSLLGLAAFSGLVGVVGIWGVIPVAAYLAARACNRATDPTVRAAGIVAACVLVGYSVQCYGDIGLQSLPCGLLLGVALATAGKVAAWSRAAALSKVGALAPAQQSSATRARLPWHSIGTASRAGKIAVQANATGVAVRRAGVGRGHRIAGRFRP